MRARVRPLRLWLVVTSQRDPSANRLQESQVSDDQYAHLALRAAVHRVGVDDLNDVVVLGPVQPGFGRALRSKGGRDLRQPVIIVGVNSQSLFDLCSRGRSLRAPLSSKTSQPDLQLLRRHPPLP